SGGKFDDPDTAPDESTENIPGLKNGTVYYVDLALDGNGNSTLAPDQLRLKTILNPLGLGLPGTATGHTLTGDGGSCTFDGASVDGDTISCGGAHGLSTGDAVEYAEGT